MKTRELLLLVLLLTLGAAWRSKETVTMLAESHLSSAMPVFHQSETEDAKADANTPEFIFRPFPPGFVRWLLLRVVGILVSLLVLACALEWRIRQRQSE